MSEQQTSYRNIAKTTSIFGGVQVIQILISIVRGKLVAVLLGAAGMGINTILVSVINFISQISTFGLSFSAVRDISQANESGDTARFAKIVLTFRRWMLFCGVLGAVLLALLSPWISEFSFGNRDYMWWFVALGLMVFFTALGGANTAILQGARQLRSMAKASLIGAFISLFTSVPLYYFWGVKGIVPALIVGAVVIYIVNWFYARQVKVEKVEMTIYETFQQGKEMAKLGIVMMISSLLGALVIYVINAFISNYGSLSDVGLYGAGNSITNQYLGVVFVAMGVEYFPRLSAVCDNKEQCNMMVNQQAEMVILIAAPLIIAMIITAPFLIRILLAVEFLPVSQFIRIVAFSMLFKASSFAIGYLSFAKGDKKLFFWLEGVYGNAMTLLFNITGYYLGGLTGVAISCVMSYVLYLIIVAVVTRIRYGFVLNGEFIKLFITFVALSLLVFVQTTFWPTISGYIISILVFGAAVWYSYRELDKRMDIKRLVLSRLRKKKNESHKDIMV